MQVMLIIFMEYMESFVTPFCFKCNFNVNFLFCNNRLEIERHHVNQKRLLDTGLLILMRSTLMSWQEKNQMIQIKMLKKNQSLKRGLVHVSKTQKIKKKRRDKKLLLLLQLKQHANRRKVILALFIYNIYTFF